MSRIKTILLIDDDPYLCSDLADILNIEGYAVLKASSGREGLARLQDAGRVDVIVCDYHMPEMNGEEVLRAVREGPDTAAIPFIMISAAVPPPVISPPVAHHFLTKPLHLESLLALIQSL
jgi:CheY-like chemotaxis protein